MTTKKIIKIKGYEIAYEDMGVGTDIDAGADIRSNAYTEISTDGADTHANKIVNTNTGKTILFVHGFPTSTRTWYDVVRNFSETHRCISLDLLGYGDSAKPFDGEYGIEAQAGIVAEFVKTLGIKGHLLLAGHSMGGGICLTLAANKMVNVNGLLLIDPACYPQRLPWFFVCLKIPVIPLFLLRNIPPKIAYYIVRDTAYHRARMKPYEHMKSYIDNVQKRGAAEAFILTANHINKGGIDTLQDKYKDISVPASIIWGRKDRIIPLDFAYKLKEDIPESTLDIIDNCGHCPQEEYPEIVSEILMKLIKIIS